MPDPPDPAGSAPCAPATAASNPSGLPLLPPPPEPFWTRARWRRRLRAVGAHTGLQHWLLVRGLPLTGVFLALYVTNGLVNCWRTTYDVTIGVISPGDHAVAVPALAWPLSVAGWLATPAIVGAAIGITIERAITARRSRSITDVLGTPLDDPDA
ncbi:hypothetical protein ACWT_3995 [Actinoplanes sp. SE50]|uniref:hypothetical protein n=1 Tax=unclassified Actinoplanes TaxID=2626549 RepID=UPI00023ED60F|nr:MULTISPECIES: hypothetical protein [unclassified Actinoplanes]AEV85019.1 hypothetical protein ACPL_4124 [Actinoplanes sp. SE50/110]ATO83410.1 hypothetical protein ACWT_3995 [Actinoplanes sp. SE50]SLM00817.1 hypothetical protein ACSP50_4050 [Actinoplanes sp. SE50/110]